MTTKGVVFTAGVIGAAVLALSAYDIYTYAKNGVDSTISRVLYRGAKSEPTISFALGYLMGHLFAPQPLNDG